MLKVIQSVALKAVPKTEPLVFINGSFPGIVATAEAKLATIKNSNESRNFIVGLKFWDE